jgi:4'-phosphopantetheinyl transferase
VLEPARSHELIEARCAPGEAHVWRVSLDCAEASTAALEASLSPEELEKAARFQSRLLRERWCVAHGALRYILAKYVRKAPNSLRFAIGPNGKPQLSPPVRNISFNLCYTGGLALVAVAAGERIGIDAEIVRSGIDVENLSRRFFSAAEADEILAEPRGLRSEASAGGYSCDRWTLVDIGEQGVAAALAVEWAAPLLRRLKFEPPFG